MTLLRLAMQKLGAGLLFGIGFGVSVGVIYYFVTTEMMLSILEPKNIANAVITEHYKQVMGDDVAVLGTVENRGHDLIRGFTLEVDLFNKSNQVVDQCSSYVKSLAPNDARHFKVSCGRCKDKPVVEHDHYEIHVRAI